MSSPPRHAAATLAALTTTTLLLGGCAVQTVEWQNPKPAQTLAREAQPPGSVYTGWRVFQDRCAQCHGAEATGSANAPNLLLRVNAMGPRRFVGLVLQRYDWAQATGPARRDTAATEALIETVMQRREQPLAMPAWQGEPRVNAHIADLYAWLSARADGRQGPGRPATP